MNLMIEYIDILDEFGQLTGAQKTRAEVHRDGDWHRTAHVWIINQNGEILLQKRSKEKENHPGMWDVSCAGHLSAGDSSVEGALRELDEELGIKAERDDLQFLATIKVRGGGAKYCNNEFTDVYILKISRRVEDLKLQQEEVDAVKFVTADELKTMIQERDPRLVQHDLEYGILIGALKTR